MTRTQPAAGERERGLRRIRRVTVATTLAATALAGGTAAAAGITLPGHATGTAQTPQQSDQSQGQQQDGLVVPDQAPQAPAAQGPLVITGSS